MGSAFHMLCPRYTVPQDTTAPMAILQPDLMNFLPHFIKKSEEGAITVIFTS